jgi:hypothetical protein
MRLGNRKPLISLNIFLSNVDLFFDSTRDVSVFPLQRKIRKIYAL